MAKKSARKSGQGRPRPAQARIARCVAKCPDLLTLALDNHPGAQKDIAKLSKVSRPSVGNFLRELREPKFVSELDSRVWFYASGEAIREAGARVDPKRFPFSLTTISSHGESMAKLEDLGPTLPAGFMTELQRVSSAIRAEKLAETEWVRAPEADLPKFRRGSTVRLSARALEIIKKGWDRRSHPWALENKMHYSREWMRATGTAFADSELTKDEANGAFKWLKARGTRDATVRSLVSGREGQLFRGLFEEA